MSIKEITVELMYFDNPDLPENEKQVASIKDGAYAGIVVHSNNIAGCFREISTSMAVLDDYRKKKASL